ncbi:hypothetical protein K9O30_14095 [Clostridium bowmanii]|uniref:hypothetical protein n=1 Tax=Clostridium bowmanii TaxID=132925 RepID=UPI001C0E55E9|nr:hypothetical protein [Clostridium bowmanii]MBU3190194.1 hypothetical protein [Clostridium bowmanii]MCA1074831.1 hypothetical protein [Clostridium bowmanii]
MDHVYEQLVTTYKTGAYKTINAATFIFAIIGLLAFSINLIFAIVLLCFAIGSFFFKKKLFVEYEYQFIYGEIKIDKIIELKKRSTVVTFNIKEVGLLAWEGSDALKDYSNKPSAIVNAYPNTSKERIFVAMVTEGNNKMQLKFVPDEEFLNRCFKINPRAIKRV